jgi:hypothetical protein
MMLAAAMTVAAVSAKAADPVIPSTHNPYTVLGVQLRSVLLDNAADGSSAISLGPAIFQEIVPCRFISTLEADRYPTQWGGPAMAPNESRAYRPTGEMVDGNFTNPCSNQIPVESLAVAARVWATGTKSTKSAGNTVVWLTPGHDVASDNKLSKIALRPGEQSMNEASVVLRDHMFTLTARDGGADLQVDIIGYFITDPYLNGAKGDKGDTGAAGPAGPAGPQGERGLQGDKGDQGSQGLQGDKGERGEKGLQGDKGDRGEQGIQGDKGLQGEKGLQGDKGERGEQGLKGDKGERGEQGLKGDKGERGEQGLKGEKGDKGEVGPAGPAGAKGDTGSNGPAGAKGDKGDKGDTGAQGPMGPQGLQGPPGLNGGPAVSSVNCIAQGQNTVTMQWNVVHETSAILVTVVGRSLGNTISVLSQGEGWVTVSGKPATCFRIVVFQ